MESRDRALGSGPQDRPGRSRIRTEGLRWQARRSGTAKSGTDNHSLHKLTPGLRSGILESQSHGHPAIFASIVSDSMGGIRGLPHGCVALLRSPHTRRIGRLFDHEFLVVARTTRGQHDGGAKRGHSDHAHIHEQPPASDREEFSTRVACARERAKRLADIKQTITLVDGSLISALPKIMEASWRKANGKPTLRTTR